MFVEHINHIWRSVKPNVDIDSIVITAMDETLCSGIGHVCEQYRNYTAGRIARQLYSAMGGMTPEVYKLIEQAEQGRPEEWMLLNTTPLTVCLTANNVVLPDHLKLRVTVYINVMLKLLIDTHIARESFAELLEKLLEDVDV